MANKSRHLRSSLGIESSKFVPQLRTSPEAVFRAAARLLTGPLAEELRETGASRVFLIPCGILGYAPLHACPTDTHGQVALYDEFDVSYLPSGAVLRSLRSRSPRSKVRRIVTVANPLPNPRPLRFAAIQQAEIASAARASGTPLTELAGMTTSPTVLAAVQDATHVDFACHGWLDQQQPLHSGLELADTPMTLRVMLDSRLVDGVQLVTLMSCQSAVPAGGPN